MPTHPDDDPQRLFDRRVGLQDLAATLAYKHRLAIATSPDGARAPIAFNEVVVADHPSHSGPIEILARLVSIKDNQRSIDQEASLGRWRFMPDPPSTAFGRMAQRVAGALGAGQRAASHADINAIADLALGKLAHVEADMRAKALSRREASQTAHEPASTAAPSEPAPPLDIAKIPGRSRKAADPATAEPADQPSARRPR